MQSKKGILQISILFTIMILAFTSLVVTRQNNSILIQQENFEFAQDIQKGSAPNNLEGTLREPVGLQGFEGEHSLSNNPNDIVEIIVQFHTLPAAALQLIQNGTPTPQNFDMPTPRHYVDVTFEEQARSAHIEFSRQLEQLERERFGGIIEPFSSSDYLEIFCETYWIFNGVHMRVPTYMVEQIAQLPEVFAVTPYIIAPVPTFEEPTDPPVPVEEGITGVQDELPPLRPSPFLQNDGIMRNTRTLLNLDAVHLDMNITGRGVVVASIDTGIDHEHPEFVRFQDATGRVPGWQFYGYDDNHGSATNHGTQTAGAIISMAPEIELWSLQRTAADVSGGTPIGALNFATQTVNADIIHTWGWLPNSPFDAESAAVSLAVELGHIVVSSVHNQARPWWPEHEIPQYWWQNDAFHGTEYNGITWQSVMNPLSPLAINVGAGTFGSDYYPVNTDNITGFSGRGPVPHTFQIKPDILVNGQWGQSTWHSNTGQSYGWFGGTSQAAPLATGITALLVQRFPNDTPYEIKARLMNTGRSITGVDQGNTAKHISAFSAGAGFARPYYALQSDTIVTAIHDVPLTTNPTDNWVERNMSSFSFGSLSEILPNNTRNFRASIRNDSNTAITYTIEHEFLNNPNDVATITLSHRTITVNPGQTRYFYVGISVAGSVHGSPAAFYEGNIHIRGGSRDLSLPFALVNPSTTVIPASRLNFDMQDRQLGLMRFATSNITSGIDDIKIPHESNILDFLTNNHKGFTEPTKEGFTFAGWYLDNNFETRLTESTTMPDRNVTLYVNWEDDWVVDDWVVDEYEISFNWNFVDAPVEPRLIVGHNRTVTLENIPEIPTREGYNFIGWQINREGYIFTEAQIAEYIVTSNVEFIAIWEEVAMPDVILPFEYEVVFNWNFDGAPAVLPVLVEFNTPVNMLDIPTNPPLREGYNFIGWQIGFEGDILTNEQIATHIITDHVEFIAVWAEAGVEYEISFNWNFVNSPRILTALIELGTTIGTTIIPAEPVREGYEFIGWQIDGDVLTNEEIALHIVTGNVELIAVWEEVTDSVAINEVTFNWNFDGAPIVLPALVQYGSSIRATIIPTTPMRDGFDFIGWQITEGGDILSNTQVATHIVTGNVEFIAVWTDTVINEPDEITEPEEIEEPTEPEEVEEPTEPEEVEEPTEPNEIEEPTEPNEIEEPTEPNEIEEPTEQDEIEEPTEPNEIEESTEQDEIEEPTEPNEIEEPTEPNEIEEPTEPNEIDEPTEPNEIDEPTEPNEIEEPTEQDEIEEPTEPNEIEEPTEPNEIEEPTEQDEIEEPTEPNETDEPTESDDEDELTEQDDEDEMTDPTEPDETTDADDIDDQDADESDENDEPTDPIDPLEPTDSNENYDSNEANDNDEPTNPIDPTDPSDVDDQFDPDDSSETTYPPSAFQPGWQNNNIFIPGTTTELTFVIENHHIDDFLSILVNTYSLVRDTDYTIASGSIILTLLENYLSSLDAGRHEVEIILADEVLEIYFVVEENIDSSDSTDSNITTAPEQGSPETEKGAPKTEQDTPEAEQESQATEPDDPEIDQELPETEQDSSEAEREWPETGQGSSETELELPETEQSSSETELELPETELESPEMEQGSPEAEQELPETEQDSPEAEQRSPETELELPETEQGSPETEQRLPETEQRFPETEQGSPEAEQRLPGTEQRFPEIVQRLPEVEQVSQIPNPSIPPRQPLLPTEEARAIPGQEQPSAPSRQASSIPRRPSSTPRQSPSTPQQESSASLLPSVSEHPSATTEEPDRPVTPAPPIAPSRPTLPQTGVAAISAALIGAPIAGIGMTIASGMNMKGKK